MRPEIELLAVPRNAVRLPLELPPPEGFDPDREETWPIVEGKLEHVGGRLLWMPPSGDEQQDTCSDLLRVLGTWRQAHRDFKVGGNEAGMKLGNDRRGADAAVWRAEDVRGYAGRFRRAPPVLAVEVAGRDDTEESLREKASWYLTHGVGLVWLLFPRERRALWLTAAEEREVLPGARMPAHTALPDLEPLLDELFEQVSE